MSAPGLPPCTSRLPWLIESMACPVDRLTRRHHLPIPGEIGAGEADGGLGHFVGGGQSGGVLAGAGGGANAGAAGSTRSGRTLVRWISIAWAPAGSPSAAGKAER